MEAATILVSETDPDVRRLLVVLIERLGHTAIVLDPDVLIPPGGDLLLVEPESTIGLEHARLVRAYFPDLPVLCMNALPEAGSFLTGGPLGYLQKPFTVDVMRTTVQASLGKSPV
ncbi:MAG: Response regulator receiver domain [Gaiellaceae bacterium]|jgi:CheY-like chemotaxis protein|nr:Response regulator receiver domain [Gaiellaceae bacterium]